MKEKKIEQPKVRFKGFTDAWEQRKFEEIWKKSSERNNELKYSPKDVISVAKMQLNPVERNSADEYMKTYNILHYGDIAFEGNKSKNYSFGRFVLNDIQNGIVSHVFITFRPISKMNIDFMKVYIKNESIMKHYLVKATTKTLMMTTLNVKDMNKQKLRIPSLEEQTKIGEFFKQLNNTITLHQREYEIAQKFKKTMLSKMFPKNGVDKPELRFAGFTDAWEQRRLGDVAERVTRKNKNLESTRPLTISAQDGLVDQNDFFNKQIASRDVSGYYLVENGEFAYNKSYSNGYPWGAIKRLDLYPNGVLSTLYIVFRPTKINSDFLVTYYDTTGWYKEVSKHAAEGARNHGLLNIAASDFFETELSFPKSEDEQTKIGMFFKQLDDLITLHQRELESLKNMKRTFLQQMFV